MILSEGLDLGLLSTTIGDGLVGDLTRSTTIWNAVPEHRDIVEYTPFVCNEEEGRLSQQEEQEVMVAGYQEGQIDKQPVLTQDMEDDDVKETILPGLTMGP